MEAQALDLGVNSLLLLSVNSVSLLCSVCLNLPHLLVLPQNKETNKTEFVLAPTQNLCPCNCSSQPSPCVVPSLVQHMLMNIKGLSSFAGSHLSGPF